MMARDVAESAVEARRKIISQRRRGATFLALFIVCLVHLQPYSEGAYTSGQLVTRLGIVLACLWLLLHGCQAYYMSTSKKAIESRLMEATEEIAMKNRSQEERNMETEQR